MHKLREIES